MNLGTVFIFGAGCRILLSPILPAGYDDARPSTEKER